MGSRAGGVANSSTLFSLEQDVNDVVPRVEALNNAVRRTYGSAQPISRLSNYAKREKLFLERN
jgi:hypothetical protein